jgi:hypothetical protein
MRPKQHTYSTDRKQQPTVKATFAPDFTETYLLCISIKTK